jgi:hypothetical protein
VENCSCADVAGRREEGEQGDGWTWRTAAVRTLLGDGGERKASRAGDGWTWRTAPVRKLLGDHGKRKESRVMDGREELLLAGRCWATTAR